MLSAILLPPVVKKGLAFRKLYVPILMEYIVQFSLFIPSSMLLAFIFRSLMLPKSATSLPSITLLDKTVSDKRKSITCKSIHMVNNRHRHTLCQQNKMHMEAKAARKIEFFWLILYYEITKNPLHNIAYFMYMVPLLDVIIDKAKHLLRTARKMSVC